MLRPTLLLVTVAMLVGQSSFASIALARQRPDIGGSYYCAGTDVNGQRYHGTVSIGKHGDVYYLEWRLGTRLAAVGFGILHDDVLAVSYYGRSSGVALYEIDGARLDGRWTEAAATGRLSLETLTRIPHSELEDTHQPVDSARVPI